MSVTEQSYAEHTDAIKRVADIALKAVPEPEFRGLYVHSLEADGQFWTVTVGVENAYDYKVEVDETTGTVLKVVRV